MTHRCEGASGAVTVRGLVEMAIVRPVTSIDPDNLQNDHIPKPALAGLARRVLLIRPSALGDVARTVPCLVTLRKAMPDAQIDWLVSDVCSDVIRHHPMLDSVIELPRKRFGKAMKDRTAASELKKWLADLRSRDYDMTIDLQGLFRSGGLSWKTGAKRRVGFANARELAWICYSFKHRHRIDKKLHTVDRMLGLLEAEGFEPVGDMQLYSSEADRQFVRELGLGESNTYACVAPTAQWLCKCWPIEKYAAVVKRLVESEGFGKRVVILATLGEQQQIQPLLDELKPLLDSGAVLWPTCTVGQMSAVIEGSKLVVCNDSGPLHIAVGFERPIVTIFGPTQPALVGPYGREDTIVQPTHVGNRTGNSYRKHRDDQSLIDQVSVDQVWQKIEGLM
jgi:heptosyltransferase I